MFDLIKIYTNRKKKKGDGTGRISIYGDKFDDESFSLRHDKPGRIVLI